MMKRLLMAGRVALRVCAAAGLAAWLEVAALGALPDGDYIVTMRDSRDPVVKAERHKANPKHIFNGRRFKGFSGHLNGNQADRLAADPDVLAVELDGPVSVAAQLVYNSVHRIGTLSNAYAHINGIDTNRVNVDIAVIDTGIQLNHPDLNVYTNISFVAGVPTGNDDYGHGTSVSGVAAALDNNIGTVGIAPGARLWAVKSIDSDGDGFWSDIIAGISWVAANASQIEVGNMSIGAVTNIVALRLAIQDCVNNGVFMVAAAGNNNREIYGPDLVLGTADDFQPAAFPEVCAVSAMGDFDGMPGGLDPIISEGHDDTLAWYSNYSSVVDASQPVTSPGGAIDISAPGTSIYTTRTNSTYHTVTGTSVACPQVAGAAALYIAQYGRATNAAGVYAIRQALINAAQPQDEWGMWPTNPNPTDHLPEGLVMVTNLVYVAPYTGASTYYIDWDAGNDANTGTTTGQAWKRCPGMNGFIGTYSHVPGDRFIFKGGVTWPRGAFQLEVSNGGSAGTRDYYGVDTNWFTGSEWSMPVWDFENVQIGTGFSSSAGVLVRDAEFITFDRIDIKRHRSPVSFGSSSVSLFGTASDVTFTNVVVRDWSVAGTGVGSDAGGGIQNYSSGRNFLIVQSLLHQDNEANKCGYAAKGINEVAYTEVRNTPNAVFGYTLGHHNHIHHIPNCTDTSSHPNAMATTGSGTSTYANLIHDLDTGVSCIFVSPDWTGGFSVDLVYNNVCYNVGLQAPIQLDTGGQNTAKIGIRAYNNVLVANGGGYCIRVVERGTGAYGTLDVRNCQLIATGTALGYNNPGIGNGNVTTVTLQNNLTMTPAAATAAGYVTGNNFAPTAVTSPTVRTGVDLSTVFNVAIDGTLRPAGLWDVAAYQFTAGGITNPPPPPPLMPDQPVGLSPAEGEVNVSLRPVLVASAFSDPQGSAQIASQWIVLQSGSVIRDSGAYVAATSYPIPTDLANFTAYGWQARYQNAFGLWSPYSAEVGFTTTNVVINPPPPPPSTNPPPPPPPPGGVRLRVTNMKAGKVRAK